MVDKLRSIIVVLILVAIHAPSQSQDKINPDKGIQNNSDPWSADRLIKSETLKDVLLNRERGNIEFVYVGPPVLFKTGHIPGAISAGQASDSSGVIKFKETLRKIDRNKKIILYCGCCLWKNCPNIRPAYSITREMGFRNVEVLYLPNNFKLDWMKQGFPIEK